MPSFALMFPSGLYAVVRESLTPISPKNSLASSASSSPLSAVIFTTHPYQQITSSRRNLQIALVVLFCNARPSTWFVKSSLARIMCRICHNPTGIVTRSTTHLKCITICRIQSVSVSNVRVHLASDTALHKSKHIFIYPFPPVSFFNIVESSPTPLCPAHKLS